MPKRVALVISGDPCKSHRPVEALRIALGLCAGEHETTVILLDQAPLLLTEETDDIIDVDILEKYLPSLSQLRVPFLVEAGAFEKPLRPEFTVSPVSPEEIRGFLRTADRSLVF
jgi:sulfur relay (sulfurtransferase) DsrF/TusC family protein